MKVLVTGANGFIGKNLCAHLTATDCCDILPYTRQTDPALLETYAQSCDFVVHLAGVNRPADDAGFEENHYFTRRLLGCLQKGEKSPPVLMTSSAQALNDNPYGRSKRKAEELLIQYGCETGAGVYIFRLPGVFGKWSVPDYNSVVATFCHRLARGLPVRIDDPDAPLPLVYIDDVVRTFTDVIRGNEPRQDIFYVVKPVHHTTVGKLAETLRGFKTGRQSLYLAEVDDPLTRKLYSTYLSFLPQDTFGYSLVEHRDERGVFAECLKSASGQVSVNITKPGLKKGGHWHHTKTEKFIVAAGSGLLRFQMLGGGPVLRYPVSAGKLEIVDVPPGYVHDVVNTGADDLVMLIWASEVYDPANPDTYPAAIQDAACAEEKA